MATSKNKSLNIRVSTDMPNLEYHDLRCDIMRCLNFSNVFAALALALLGLQLADAAATQNSLRGAIENKFWGEVTNGFDDVLDEGDDIIKSQVDNLETAAEETGTSARASIDAAEDGDIGEAVKDGGESILDGAEVGQDAEMLGEEAAVAE